MLVHQFQIICQILREDQILLGQLICLYILGRVACHLCEGVIKGDDAGVFIQIILGIDHLVHISVLGHILFLQTHGFYLHLLRLLTQLLIQLLVEHIHAL